VYAKIITDEMESSAKARGTGIARRSPEYIAEKMEQGKAVIAVTNNGDWVGFCYIETWSHGEYVANSGLIVVPAYRKSGVAKAIKQRIFNLSRRKISGRENFWADYRPRGNENKFRAWAMNPLLTLSLHRIPLFGKAVKVA
jgi:hypothetical protein